jgi:hypothetical protein
VSTPSVQDAPLQVTDKRASLASSLVTLAGYPGLIPDNSYAPNMDAAINAGTMATLLPQDLGISTLSAASIGFSLAALEGTYPMDDGASFIVLHPMSDSTSQIGAEFVAKTIQDTMDVAPVNQKLIDLDPYFAKLLGEAKMDLVTCKARDVSVLSMVDKGKFNFLCALPPVGDEIYVRVAGTYSGDEFNSVMPDMKAKKYAVILVRSTVIKAKSGLRNVFKYEHGVLSNSIAILPFISANSQGKHLVYLNGKATLI